MEYFGLSADDIFLWDEIEQGKIRTFFDEVNFLDKRFDSTPQYNRQKYTFKYGNYDSMDLMLLAHS